MASQILSALDAMETQHYHFKAIIITGMGLFTDGYYLFCIPSIMRLIGTTWYPNFNQEMEKSLFEVPLIIATIIISVPLMGAVTGQLVFGRLGGRLGRGQVYGVTLVMIIVGSIGSEFSFLLLSRSMSITLVFFWFGLWIGIGGDYPLSATIMSEFANRRSRGAFIAGVFSMQGFGMLLSSLVTMIICSIFNVWVEKNKPFSGHQQSGPVLAKSELAWRLILMMGAIPASMTYYWRMKMPETARFTALVKKDPLQAAKDMEKVLNISLSLILEDTETMISSPITLVSYTYAIFSKEFLRRHGRDLIAAATNIFLIDIVFYSLNLFQYHMILKSHTNSYGVTFQVAVFQAIVAACATIPAYFVTLCLIDYVGRVIIQAMGFFFMAICLFTMAKINKDSDTSIMILYGLTLFFSNFGPNTTTFIVPAELFPAKFRATCHGVSGAVGKVGAIVGTIWFLWASGDPRQGVEVSNVLMSMGVVCILGSFVTYCFTQETMGRSLEKNENDDELTGIWFVRFWPNKIWDKAFQQTLVN